MGEKRPAVREDSIWMYAMAWKTETNFTRRQERLMKKHQMATSLTREVHGILSSQVYDDHYQGALYETWHIIVQARLRMDVHSLLGQQSPADLVVRGDRYSRKVRAFSSAPAEVSFEPANAFQLVPGAYNR